MTRGARDPRVRRRECSYMRKVVYRVKINILQKRDEKKNTGLREIR